MMQPQPAMIRRAAAAQATLDHFYGRPFAFGKADCVRLVAFHLRQLGLKPNLARAGSYSSAKGARAALRRAGFESLGDALDALGLLRIAPAEAVAADIVQGASGDAFGALGVVLGNGRLVGYHEHATGAAVLQQVDLVTAWRVPA